MAYTIWLSGLTIDDSIYYSTRLLTGLAVPTIAFLSLLSLGAGIAGLLNTNKKIISIFGILVSTISLSLCIIMRSDLGITEKDIKPTVPNTQSIQ
jgi:hypothetical protein